MSSSKNDPFSNRTDNHPADMTVAETSVAMLSDVSTVITTNATDAFTPRGARNYLKDAASDLTHINDTRIENRSPSPTRSSQRRFRKTKSFLDSSFKTDAAKGAGAGAEEFPVELIDMSATSSGDFLEHCVIYLSGFSGQKSDKLRRIINAGCGSKATVLNENVTHVVMEGFQEKDVSNLKQYKLQCYVVNPRWLIDCFKTGKNLSPDPYLREDVLPKGYHDDTESPNVAKRPRLCSYDNDNGKVAKNLETEKDEILNQYMHDSTLANFAADNEMMLAAFDQQPEQRMSQRDFSPNAETMEQNVDTDNAQLAMKAIGAETETDIDAKEPFGSIFTGLSFYIAEENFDGINLDELHEQIKTCGGQVIDEKTDADYCVLGTWVEKTELELLEVYPRSKVVSLVWVQMCMENGQILPIEATPLARPVIIQSKSEPLQDCVISTSQYEGSMRDALMHLAQILGAQ